MYEKFFSLDERPFDGLPDKRFYYVGSAQHEALDLLNENLNRPGSICVLSGASGSGKTTLVRMLIRSLPTRMRIIAIDDPRLDPNMLLAVILRALGTVATSLESVAELTLKLRQTLERNMSSGILTTVICDEAQGLSDEVLEQIRLIYNIEGEQGKMINFLLVGQEDLIANVQKPEHAMLWGRINAFAVIPSLKREEVQAYVTYRLQQAGCHEPIFTDKALNELHKSTGGLPRLINSVADRSLEIACEAERHLVSARMVRKAVLVVRHHPRMAGERLQTLSGRLGRSLVRLLLPLVTGVLLAVGSFAACYFYLPQVLNKPELSTAVAKDQSVQEAYGKLLDGMLRGRSAQGREQARFDIDVASSLFRADAVGTLIGLWGYQRSGGEAARCVDLKRLRLKCVLRQGSLDELESTNRPAVVSLRDDNMTPFYAVLHSLEQDRARLIMGKKLWEVDKAYLEHVYDGEYLTVRHVLPEEAVLEALREDGITAYADAYAAFTALTGVKKSLRSKKDLLGAYREFMDAFSGSNAHERELSYDLLMGSGPLLYR